MQGGGEFVPSRRGCECGGGRQGLLPATSLTTAQRLTLLVLHLELHRLDGVCALHIQGEGPAVLRLHEDLHGGGCGEGGSKGGERS